MRSIDYFDKGAEINPERAAIVDGDRTYSFKEVQALTYDIAKAMQANGLKRQDLVAMYAPNDAWVLITLLGLWRAGCVWIPVNARNAIDANAAYLNYVRCKWIFYHSSFSDDVANLASQVPSLTNIVCIDKADAGHKSMEQFIASGRGETFDEGVDAFGNLDELVGIFATGGTTGPAKGVQVTNLGWGTMLEIAGNGLRIDEPGVCLVTAPLTHAAGPISTVTLGLGMTQVIMPGFDALKVMQNIERHKVTHIYLPPTALYMVLDHPDLHKFDYSSLRRLLLVGSPVSPEKFKRAVEVFGPCVCQCYGQVECPMIVTWLPPEVAARAAAGDHPERLASCGKPSYPVRVAILDDDGNHLPNGAPGEICVRGALVSHSYFEMPEATKDVRTFGWHHTGDVGYRDDDGYIFIVDRKKDMVVTGGFNVYSAEVEACVMELPEVAGCAVIGVPDDKWGEAVKAIVVKAQGADISAEKIIEHAKTRLGGVKAPKSVDFWESIPTTANNKMDKKAIRSKYWGGATRAVN